MDARILLTLLTLSALVVGVPLSGAQYGGGQEDPDQGPPDGQGEGDPQAGNQTGQDGSETADGNQTGDTGDDPADDRSCERGQRCAAAAQYRQDRARYEAGQARYRNFEACLTDGEDECARPGAEAAQACARLADQYQRGDVPADLPAAAAAGRCFSLREMTESVDRRRHIDMDVDPEAHAVWAYTVGGVLLADGIWFEAPEDQVILERTDRQPHAITVYFSGAETEWRSSMRLHDNPTGLASVKAGNGTFFLDLPDNATVETLADAQVYRITLEDGTTAHLAGEGITLEGDLASTQDFMSLHRPVDGTLPARVDRPAPVDQQVHQAMERRHLGATISVQKQAAHGPAVVEDQFDAPEILSYDDVAVQLATPVDTATPDDPLRIEVDADLEEGRTIVIDVDRDLFADPSDLQLRYFDVLNEAGRSHEVEVFLVQAQSLQDAMDPTDDGIQPEYWIVEDADGIHIILSVPHWSTHALTVASTIVEVIQQPSVAAGMLAGLIGSLIATYGMFRPRRPSD